MKWLYRHVFSLKSFRKYENAQKSVQTDYLCLTVAYTPHCTLFLRGIKRNYINYIKYDIISVVDAKNKTKEKTKQQQKKKKQQQRQQNNTTNKSLKEKEISEEGGKKTDTTFDLGRNSSLIMTRSHAAHTRARSHTYAHTHTRGFGMLF